MTPLLKNTLPYFEEAKPLWDVIHQRFNVGNGARKQQLKAALAECQQSITMSIAEYFGKLQTLWDELATYNPLPNCTCEGCKCDIGATLQAQLDEDRLHAFLFGINVELYGTMRSSILSQDPLPSLDRAYQRFIQEERLQMASRTQVENTNIRALHILSDSFHDSKTTTPLIDKSKFLCTHCNRRGHNVDACWAKHGYPEWWEHGTPRGGGRPMSRGAKGGRHNQPHKAKPRLGVHHMADPINLQQQ